ncbi:MAG: hypothetical protein ABIH34_00310 [Nanoarchaeota archaeon]
MSTITLDQLKELVYSTSRAEEVIQLQGEICDRIGEALADRDLEGSIDIVGSSNPERMTLVIEPTTAHIPFPPDFDIDIILDEPVEEEQARELLSIIFPEGHYRKVRGLPQMSEQNRDYFVTVCVMDKEKAEKELPNRYSKIARPLRGNEPLETQTFKLWTMRNGTYAGFDHGIKGIAATELVKMYGNAATAITYLHECLSNLKRPVILSPVNGDDLLKNVSGDIWKRIRKASEVFVKEEKVEADIFELLSWIYAHPMLSSSHIPILCSPGSCGRDGSEIYKYVKDVSDRTSKKFNIRRLMQARYVIPCHSKDADDINGHHTHVYLALKPQKPLQRETRIFKFISGEFDNYQSRKK